MQSINPYNNQLLASYPEFSSEKVNEIISKNYSTWLNWRNTGFEERSKLMYKAAAILRKRKAELAKLITLEMGKRIAESIAEVEKCAWVCEYYAENAESFLADEPIKTDAQKSMAVFEPIGPVLAVMPWNYPFWQVFRFAAPALMAGNTGLLKHASNVQGCALAIESIFTEAGFPKHTFDILVIGSAKVEAVIANAKVAAVTLTGSEYAGSKVAAAAGKYLKKSVLELGGSDPCIVLNDANLDEAASVGLTSRMLTTGQTCIAAKRFFVESSVYEAFKSILHAKIKTFQAGDPMDKATTIAPLSQRNFVEEVHDQVIRSKAMGASVTIGGEIAEKGCFYPITLIENVEQGMPVFDEETFGPVIALIKVEDETEAIEKANDSLFGLGAAVWTENLKKGEDIARKIEAGAVFVNGLVKSDPRLPFGGIKNSGFGRELANYGIKEFCNIKSVWIR